MVLKTYHECDRCGQKCEFDTLYFCVDRRADGAGSVEDVHESLDLCNTCSRSILYQWISQLEIAEAKTMLAFFREKIKPIRM